MTNKCQNCGENIKAESKFCSSCGKVIQNDIYNQSSLQETVSHDSIDSTKEYSSTQSKKSNKKIIGILIAIIALVVIIAVVFIVFFGGSSNDKFIGTWNISSGEDSNTSEVAITFQANGDLMGGAMGYNMKFGTWSVEGNMLCFNVDVSFFNSSTSGKQCFNYSFSDGGNTLKLLNPYSSSNHLVLTKNN